jgi:hypothetical protein
LPGSGGSPDGLDWLGLGDGDQPDVPRLAPGAAGRIRDSVTNTSQVLGNVLIQKEPATFLRIL